MTDLYSSPVPWKMKFDANGEAFVTDATDSIVFSIGEINDMRRVVACVNACREIPTEVLEQEGMSEFLACCLLPARQRKKNDA